MSIQDTPSPGPGPDEAPSPPAAARRRFGDAGAATVLVVRGVLSAPRRASRGLVTAARATRRAMAGLRAELGRLVRAAGRLGRLGLKGGILVVILSTVLATGAFAASTFYGQYSGAQAEPNTRSWALRTPSYAHGCGDCHAKETVAQAAGKHASVTCEVCHGAMGGHPGATPSAGSATASAAVPMPSPNADLCITCHLTAAGRPAALPQIDPPTHYRGASCVRCHDPHAIVAVAPPDVTHPLERLPACTTCHAPNGLKKIPTGHELVADGVCLTCHRVANGGR